MSDTTGAFQFISLNNFLVLHYLIPSLCCVDELDWFNSSTRTKPAYSKSAWIRMDIIGGTNWHFNFETNIDVSRHLYSTAKSIILSIKCTEHAF